MLGGRNWPRSSLSGDEEEIPKWVPPTLDGRLDLAGRIDIAAEILSTRIEQNAAKLSGKRKDPTKIVVSLSDPEAPLGRDKLKVYRRMPERKQVYSS